MSAAPTDTAAPASVLDTDIEEFPGVGERRADPLRKAGVRTFPSLVPISPEMPGVAEARAAGLFWSTTWSGPTFMAIGMRDPVLGPPAMRMLRGVIRGCPEPMELAEAGHFVQESGDLVAEAALASFAAR